MSLKHAENCILMKKKKKSKLPGGGGAAAGLWRPRAAFGGAGQAQAPAPGLLGLQGGGSKDAAFRVAPGLISSPSRPLLLTTSPHLFPSL